MPVRLGEHAIEDARELARVVDIAKLGPVRKARRRNHVAFADRDRVDAHFAPRLFDQPLHEVVRFRPSGTTIRAGGHGVREHPPHVVIDDRDVIHGRLHFRPEHERDDRRRADRHRTEIGQHLHLQGEDFPVLVQRQAGSEQLVATALGREELLASFSTPPHRTAEPACCKTQHRVLRVQAGLHAEAAAHVADHDPEGLGLGLEHCGQGVARARRLLRLGIERPALLLEHRGRTARLECRGDQALVVEFDRGDVCRLGKRIGGRLHVAVSRLRGDVPRGSGKDLRRTRFDRLARIDHARQFIVVDGHELGRILRLLTRFGDDCGNGVPCVVGDVACQGGTQRGGHGFAVRLLEQRRERDVAQPVCLQVGDRINREDARGLDCRRDIDRADPGVGIRRADHHEPGLPCGHAIVAVKALPCEQPVVLDALLRTRGTKSCGIGIELDGRCIHGQGLK